MANSAATAQFQLAVQSALCVIPPTQHWPSIQAIRKSHDKQIKRWPPHINLLYPFVDLDSLADDQIPLVAQTLRTAVSPLQPFQIDLSNITRFVHPKSATMYAEPASDSDLKSLQTALEAAFPQASELRVRGGDAGFTPHLSLGQIAFAQVAKLKGRKAAREETNDGLSKRVAAHLDSTLADVRSAWPVQGVSFLVDRVYWIRRSKADDSVPFEIVDEFRFGGMQTEEDPLQRPVPERSYDPFKPSVPVPRALPAAAPMATKSETRTSTSELVPWPTYFRHLPSHRWISIPTNAPDPRPLPTFANPTLTIFSQNCFSGIPDTEESPSALLTRFQILERNMLVSQADLVVTQESTAQLIDYLYRTDSPFAERFPFSTHHREHPTVLATDPANGAAGTCVIFSRYLLDSHLELKLGPLKSAACIDFTLNMDSRPIRVSLVNLHLTSDYRADNRVKRGEQLRSALFALTESGDADIAILVGDFNTAPEQLAGLKSAPRGQRTRKPELDSELEEPAISIARSAGFQDAWELTHPSSDSGFTYDPFSNALAYNNATEKGVARRYDRLYFDSKIGSVEKCDVVSVADSQGNYGSDHEGLLTVLKLSTGLAKEAKVPETTKFVAKLEAVSGDWDDSEWLVLLPSLRKSEDARGKALELLRTGRFLSKPFDEAKQDAFRLVPIGSFALGVPADGNTDLDLVCVGTLSEETFWRNVEPIFAIKGVKVLRVVKDALVPLAELAVLLEGAKLLKADVQYLRIEPAQMKKLCKDATTVLKFTGKLGPAQGAIASVSLLLDKTSGSAKQFRRLIFLTRRWAKKRGVYSTKFGYPGGFGLAVLCARLIVELGGQTAQATTSALLRAFFAYYSKYPWTTRAVLLDGEARSEGGCATIFSPAQHGVNIVRNGNPAATKLWTSELARAVKILESPCSTEKWNELCTSGLDEVLSCPRIVKVSIGADELTQFRQLSGWTESRLVGLVRRLADAGCRPWTDSLAQGTSPWPFRADYFVGIVELIEQRQAEDAAQEFRNGVIASFGAWVQGTMAVEVEVLSGLKGKLEVEAASNEDDLEIDLNMEIPEMELDLGTPGSGAASADLEAIWEARAKAKAKVLPTSNGSGTKLRTSLDVFNRIAWDPLYDSSRSKFRVGYEDRFKGIMEMPFLSFRKDSTHDEFIPFHRVVYFKAPGGRIIWDRRTRVDLVFE